MIALILSLGCRDLTVEMFDPPADRPDAAPPGPSTCDAGTDVWVQRVFPLVLGRRPHGAAEVGMWAGYADREGRDATVRALSRSPEYREWWKVVLSDLLYASRTAIDLDAACFATPRMAVHDGSLARHLRSNAPDGRSFGQPFDMADVLVDALVADDLSAVYQANLFARMNNVQASDQGTIEESERAIRLVLGDQLLETYVDRNVACMDCHNSEFSVTDDPDPAYDHAWGVDAPFEAALFGSSTGPADPDDFYAMSRSYGLVYNAAVDGLGDESYPARPWGMDGSCGAFRRDPPNFDILGKGTSFFGRGYGSAGTVWELERTFAEGVEALADGPLPTSEVGPGQAFAYLTAQHLADQVWRLAFGERLLLPYGLSRNRDQQERLQALTDGFVASGWSLAELLVAVAGDPYFNTGLPGTCEVEPYGLLPVVDPYTVESGGDVANNGPGDLVHRYEGRLLLRGLYESLGYGEPPEWFVVAVPEEDFQRSLGIFLSDASPGSDGVDFQGMLAWEREFHACEDPIGGGGGFLRDLREAAVSDDGTVEDAVLALRDRLLARGVFDDAEERDAVEALLGMPLSTPVADADADLLNRNLGLLCGVLTASPGFVLAIEPLPSGPVPTLALGVDEDCRRMEGLVGAGCD